MFLFRLFFFLRIYGLSTVSMVTRNVCYLYFILDMVLYQNTLVSIFFIWTLILICHVVQPIYSWKKETLQNCLQVLREPSSTAFLKYWILPNTRKLMPTSFAWRNQNSKDDSYGKNTLLRYLWYIKYIHLPLARNRL